MNRYKATTVTELRTVGKKLVELNGVEIGLFHVNGAYVAWRNLCPHAAAPICAGKVCGTTLTTGVYEYEYGYENEIIRCPWHGWEFHLITGRHLADESVKLKGYQVEVEGEDVYVLM